MKVTHRGYLWVVDPVSINMELISYITGLPSRGENPAQYPNNNTKEKALAEEMKKTYGTERGPHKIIIKHISDATTRLATKIMTCKLLRKCRKEDVLAGGCRDCNTMCRGHYAQLAPLIIKHVP
jgi:hypothetical protein